MGVFEEVSRRMGRENELKDRRREAEVKKAEAEARLAEAELEMRLRELQGDDSQDEDAERGRKVKAGASKGGRALRNEDRNEAIVEAVTSLHERRSNLSWTRVCDLVGEDEELSGHQVRTIAKRAGVEPWHLT